MAKGSLPSLVCTVKDNGPVVELNIAAPTSLPTTLGALSDALIASEAYKIGDILTLVVIGSEYYHTIPSAVADNEGESTWIIKQIILDSSSTATIADTLGMKATNVDGNLVLVQNNDEDMLSATYASFTMVHTRNTSVGLKASTQELILTTASTTVYDNSFADAYKSAVIAAWQANGSVDAAPDAILQGSIAYEG